LTVADIFVEQRIRFEKIEESQLTRP
jgi:hypothetical protein